MEVKEPNTGDAFERPLSQDNAIDIPNFASEEAKPLFPPGSYLFALGHITPKSENNVVMNVMQEYYVLKFIGDPYEPVNEWRIKFDKETGKLWMPSHKGTKRFEFFDNPFIKPKMKWKTSAFYNIFPGVLTDKASLVPGDSTKPTKECNWKVVASKYGQIFQADLVVNKYTDKEGNKKSNMQLGWDTFVLVPQVLSIEQMTAIQSRWDESKALDGGTDTTSHAKEPDMKIDDDLPF